MLAIIQDCGDYRVLRGRENEAVDSWGVLVPPGSITDGWEKEEGERYTTILLWKSR